MTVLLWGTCDMGKPRNRIMVQGLGEHGVSLVECRRDVWGAVEDKSGIKSGGKKLRFLAKWLAAYPALVYRYLRAERHEAALVGYLGQIDVLVLWPFARLRGVPIIWDAFISLYNTVVEDRQLLKAGSAAARALWLLEWLACRAATRITLDTAAHAEYFRRTFKLPETKLSSFFVGAEDLFQPPRYPASGRAEGPFSVLFYGQFIPLHGIPTIIEAARLLEHEPIEWVIIGQGQETPRIESMLQAHPLEKLRQIPWVPYEMLLERIHAADVCLGIFGGSEKSANVIPNKAFQILAAGGRLITMDSAAARELVESDTDGVTLVPRDDPRALADAILNLKARIVAGTASPRPPSALSESVRPRSVTLPLVDLLRSIGA